MKKNRIINLKNIKERIKKEIGGKEVSVEIKPQNELIHSWKANEYAFYEKNLRWYLMGGIFIAILVGIAIWTGNYLMAVTSVLFSVIVYGYTKRRPKKIKFEILYGGINAGGVFYDFSDLKSFWIFYLDPPHDAYVSIRKKKKFAPYIQLPIGEADPARIRRELLKFIPEQKHEEEFVNKVEKLFKF